MEFRASVCVTVNKLAFFTAGRIFDGIAGLITLTAMLGTAVAHQVIVSLDPSWGKSSGVSSRVKTGLEIQARAASWKPDEHVVAMPATIEPALSPGALAFIDSAESAGREPSAVKASVMRDPRSSGESTSPKETIAFVQPSAPEILPPIRKGPAVAGWRRRAMVRRVEANDKSPARIIERNLRNLI